MLERTIITKENCGNIGFGLSLKAEQEHNLFLQLKKLNVIFKTTQGTTHTLVYNYGITIDQALSKYLNRVGRPELYDQKSNKICFLFNASQLKFGDQTKIEVFFKGVTNPKVVVNDVHNLSGA